MIPAPPHELVPHPAPVRVLLTAAETRLRMHLRRLLAAGAAIEVVGHVRPGAALADAAQRSGASVLLVDATENPPAIADVLRQAAPLRLPAIVLVGTARFVPSPDSFAVRLLPRPTVLEAEATQSPFGQALIEALLAAAGPRPGGSPNGAAGPARAYNVIAPPFIAPPLIAPTTRHGMLRPELIAIGSSTGGPQALPAVLGRLTGRIRQPIVITQHMPAAFTQMLAEHLGRSTAVPTVEAREGMALVGGRAHIAPGGSHLVLAREADQVICHLDNGPPENFCRPAVDPMLRSAVSLYGGRVIAVILTGMGQDGLLGCRTLVEAGGSVLAQDEASSVVWGMPGAVAQAGICHAVLPLDRIADGIIALAGGGPMMGFAPGVVP
jgi:two-component system chemotaxis response regulator CheB